MALSHKAAGRLLGAEGKVARHAAASKRPRARRDRPAPAAAPTNATFDAALLCPVMACLCAHTRRAARSFTRYYDEWLKATGLRSTQVILLVHIDAAGPRTLSSLADELLMDRTTLSRNIRPLAARGWLAVKSGRDKREIIVSTTERGRAKLQSVYPYWKGAQSKLVAAFGRERAQALLAALKHGAEVPQRLLGGGSAVNKV